MFDEISFLVQETFQDAEKKAPNQGLLSHLLSGSKGNESLPEEVPGVLYHLQVKASTFVIRIQPSENLKEDYQNVLKHADLYPGLRLHEADSEIREHLRFFECDNFQVAKSIKTQLGNKRFPLFEEHVFNVSDPGDSWWLDINENNFSILFKLSHTDNIQKLVKLGPLGDIEKYQELFGKLAGYFEMFFPVSEHSSGHGKFHIGTSDEHSANFHHFQNIFLNGEIPQELWEQFITLERNSSGGDYLESLQKANYFMMELAMLRSFWIEIQKLL